MSGSCDGRREAAELWRELYNELPCDPAPGIIGPLTARAPAIIGRVSMVYALLDGSPLVERRHLGFAWEFYRYSRWSAQHVFVGAGTGDHRIDRILARLPPATSSTAGNGPHVLRP